MDAQGARRHRGKKQLGREVFDKAAQGFDEQFQQAAEDALDEVINKL